MIRRIVLVLAMAAMLMVMLAVPAFAAADPNANCVGETATSPGFTGIIGNMASEAGGLSIAHGAGRLCASP
jgi:hypothetical protein